MKTPDEKTYTFRFRVFGIVKEEVLTQSEVDCLGGLTNYRERLSRPSCLGGEGFKERVISEKPFVAIYTPLSQRESPRM